MFWRSWLTPLTSSLSLPAPHTQKVTLTGLAWWIGAQSVTLHIFNEGAYQDADDDCLCEVPPTERGTVSYDFCLVCDDKWKLNVLGILYFLPGWFLGAVVWGAVCDRMGRRPAYILSLSFATLCMCLSAISPTFWTYAVSRCLLGFNMGGNGVVSFVLGCEWCSTQWSPLVGVGYYHLVFPLAEAFLGVCLSPSAPQPLGCECRLFSLQLTTPVCLTSYR